MEDPVEKQTWPHHLGQRSLCCMRVVSQMRLGAAHLVGCLQTTIAARLQHWRRLARFLSAELMMEVTQTSPLEALMRNTGPYMCNLVLSSLLIPPCISLRLSRREQWYPAETAARTLYRATER